MPLTKRTRKQACRFIRRWNRGLCSETWLSGCRDTGKRPESIEEQRHWLRSILGHYARLASESAARIMRHRLLGLSEGMPCVPHGEKDPEGWRRQAHRDLVFTHRIQLGIALACRKLLKGLPAPKPKHPADLFAALEDAEGKPNRTKKPKVS